MHTIVLAAARGEGRVAWRAGGPVYSCVTRIAPGHVLIA